jgi:L-asparaginase II
MYPRSAAKPVQAAGMLRLGLQLPDDLLPLVCASHQGEPQHVAGVRRILALAGLDDSALACTPKLPGYGPAARDVLRSGGGEASIYSDCSGKHAGMLATCVSNGWPVDDYLAADHPLQRSLLGMFVEVTGASDPHLGVDGCGAPIWACPLVALARSYAQAVAAAPGLPLRRAADAMRDHPELVSGTDSEVTGLMRAVPGLLVKEGAEGVYAAAHPEWGAVAVKTADGAFRAGQVAVVAALGRLGVPSAALAPWARVPVLGHGRPVGEVRPVAPAEQSAN